MSNSPVRASPKGPVRKVKVAGRKMAANLTRKEIDVRARRFTSKYADKDFDEIAAALGVLSARVKQHASYFEAAALWYRLDRRSPKRARPTEMREQLQQIRDAADRLLAHLGIDVDDACDGPADPEIFDALVTVTDDSTEDDVARATAKIGRLAEILDAVSATFELKERAHQAAEDVVDIGSLTVPVGRHGDQALNSWAAAILGFYENWIGVKAFRLLDRGQGARLYRFLSAAGRPLGIEQTSAQWKERVKVLIRSRTKATIPPD